jgi:hypothetical protein
MFTKLINREENKELNVFSGVKGLVSHGEQLKEILTSIKPEILLITISQGEIDGLSAFIREPFEMNLSDYEIIYGVRLTKYGEVMTPPPIYVESVKYLMDTGKKGIGLDMSQEQFDALYSETMKTRHLIRHSIRKKRILNYDFKDKNEYEFSENWIKRVNAVKGLAKIDETRIDYMADAIDKFSRNSYNPSNLIVADYEFHKPLMTRLEIQGWMPKSP